MRKSQLFVAAYACLISWVLLLTGYPTSASAASLRASALAASYDANGVRQDICYDYSSSTLQAACQGTYDIPGSVSVLNYNASASADYGVLKVFSQTSIDLTTNGSGGPEELSARGDTWFRDQWTITGGEPGTTGTLELSFDITGTYGFMGSTGISYWLPLTNFTQNTFTSDNQLPNSTAHLSTNFIFGSELDFQVRLYGGSILLDTSTGGYDGQSSFIDMSNSAIMNAIVVRDSIGNVVPFSLSTASRATLFDELAVPIPTAVWLFCSGLLGLIGISRRKKIA